MAILKGILKESLDYYVDLSRRLQARLKELPRGSIVRRRIGEQHYHYLVYRDGRRVVSKYLGKPEPVEISKQIDERRIIKRQIKEVKENLHLIARIERPKRHGRHRRKNP